MPKVNFPNVDSISEYAPLPDGEYLCTLSEVEMDFTRAGDEMWRLRWQVKGGEHDGRLLFDNMVFSPRALPRAKLICASCGLDVSAEVDLKPEMLLDRSAMITTRVEEYKDDHGVSKARNVIPWDGYRDVPDSGDSTPF